MPAQLDVVAPSKTNSYWLVIVIELRVWFRYLSLCKGMIELMFCCIKRFDYFYLEAIFSFDAPQLTLFNLISMQQVPQ